MVLGGFVDNGFNPENDIPNLSGKVILVTGGTLQAHFRLHNFSLIKMLAGNSGLGQESVIQLAKHNASQIFLTARSEEKGHAAVKGVKDIVPGANITFLQLDLASFASITSAAKVFNESTSRLDILINNAGIMMGSPGTTKEGFEVQFGTNHMGHALLTRLLLPKLQSTAKEPGADVRIITLSSLAHEQTPRGGLQLDNIHSEQIDISPLNRYGQSKLANILYSKELARRCPDIRCISVHPGGVDTGLSRGPKESYRFVAPLITFLIVSNKLIFIPTILSFL